MSSANRQIQKMERQFYAIMAVIGVLALALLAYVATTRRETAQEMYAKCSDSCAPDAAELAATWRYQCSCADGRGWPMTAERVKR